MQGNMQWLFQRDECLNMYTHAASFFLPVALCTVFITLLLVSMGRHPANQTRVIRAAV